MNTGSRNNKKIPVITIFGPTCVGKTDLVAGLFAGRGEVVCADSMQVYRFLDIGTAKPDSGVLSILPHHLIDIRNPDEQYTVGDFVRDAEECITAVARRGRLPIVCGGTAFYLKNLMCGPPASPPSNPGIRSKVKAELEEQGPDRLYEELVQLDPQAASAIRPRDLYRLTRALEVIRTTGKPLSSFSMNEKKESPFVFLSIGLDRDRKELAARIELRVRDMFRSGLLDEVRDLLRRGYGFSCPGMKGIGYREFALLRERPCIRTRDLIGEIAAHTRQYAKRQLTFFKSLPDVVWMHPETPTAIRDKVEEFLAEKG